MSKSGGKARGIRSVICALLVSVIVVSAICTAIYVMLLKPDDFSHIIPVSGDGTGYYRHNYNDLNDDERYVYSVILQQIYSHPEKIEIPSLENCDLGKIYEALSLDNPDLFGLSYNCSSYTMGEKTFFVPKYEMSHAQYKEFLRQTESMAAIIINGAKQYKTQYEQEKYVHDYIINHCSYMEPEKDHSANTIYGCLVLGKASCEGYSRSFQYIMNQLDIDNRLVTGESADDGKNYVGHMWNYVEISGNGYFVDLTWDDPRTEGNVLRHTYLNFSTADMFINHRNIEQNLPLCTSIEYNYFVQEGAYLNIGSGETFRALVTASVKDAIGKQYDCVELRFSDKIVAEQAKNTLFNTGVIYEIYQSVGLLEATAGAQVYYSTDENINTLCIFF